MSDFIRKKVGTCPSGCTTFSYDLPIRLDETILPYIEKLGKFLYPFGKTPVLKLEGSTFTLSGLRRLKFLHIVLKKGATEKDLLIVESALKSWLDNS
jgi:hypothetical protein